MARGLRERSWTLANPGLLLLDQSGTLARRRGKRIRMTASDWL